MLACAIAVTCALPLGAADRPWQEVRGRTAFVYGQQSAGTLRDLAIELDQFHTALGGLIRGANEPLSVPTLVYAFDDRKSLAPFLPLYEGKPASIAGYCHCGGSDSNFIALDLGSFDDSSRIVFHEYTHLLLRNAARTMPVWLNEGLAEHYSTFHLRAGGREAEIGHVIPSHIAVLRERRIPVADVLAVDWSSPLYNESDRRGIFYAESWALTHMILVGRPDGAAALNRYAAAVASGVPGQQALAEALEAPVGDLDKRLREYVLKPAFASYTYQFTNRIEAVEPSPARRLPTAESEASLGEVQMKIGRDDDAAARIANAVRIDAANPRAQFALGLLKLKHAETAAAWTALDRAAERAPDDFRIQYAYGVTLLQRASEEREHASQHREAARAALARALAAYPDSADALAWQAYADLMLDKRLPDARAAITRAIALAPGRVDFRVELAEICVRQEDEPEARRVLADILRSKPAGKDDADHHRAQELLNRLDERARAVKALAERIEAAAPVGNRDLADGTVEVTYPDDDVKPRPSDRREYRLRKVQPGEERAFGKLAAIECGPAGVRFHLRVGSRAIVATAKRMEDVELTSFLDTKDFEVRCGSASELRLVYLTWRQGGATKEGALTVVGPAVALEFVPE